MYTTAKYHTGHYTKFGQILLDGRSVKEDKFFPSTQMLSITLTSLPLQAVVTLVTCKGTVKWGRLGQKQNTFFYPSVLLLGNIH